MEIEFMARSRGATLKQKAFCHEYIVNYNATKAAISAGYSEKTAYSIGSELLKKPEIKDYIDELIRQKLVVADLTKEKILEELMAIAFIDPKKIFDNEGNPKPISQIDKKSRKSIAAIKSIKTKTGDRILEYKLHDKGAAIDKLMRHTALYEPTKIDANVSLDNELIVNIIQAVKPETKDNADTPDSD